MRLDFLLDSFSHPQSKVQDSRFRNRFEGFGSLQLNRAEQLVGCHIDRQDSGTARTVGVACAGAILAIDSSQRSRID